jgi:hypothetical protein
MSSAGSPCALSWKAMLCAGTGHASAKMTRRKGRRNFSALCNDDETVT